MEDPRIQWRMLQEAMIRDYLKSAQENISVRIIYSHFFLSLKYRIIEEFLFFKAKENILQLKHERLTLAEQELSNLNHILQRINEKQQQQQQNQLVILTSSKTSRTFYFRFFFVIIFLIFFSSKKFFSSFEFEFVE